MGKLALVTAQLVPFQLIRLPETGHLNHQGPRQLVKKHTGSHLTADAGTIGI